MGDDDSGGIGDIFSDVVGAAGDELKKFGSSASSQVVGSKGTQQASNSTYDYSLFGELKKLGQSATSQVSGHEPPISEGDVRAMAKSDDAFSKKESAAVAAKIKQIYAQYAAKSAQEEKQEEMVGKQKEEMKEEQKKEIKKEETNAAIQKTRPEIKNYGAE